MNFDLVGGTGDSGTPTSTESAIYPLSTMLSQISSAPAPSISASQPEVSSYLALSLADASSSEPTSSEAPLLAAPSSFSSFSSSFSSLAASSSSFSASLSQPLSLSQSLSLPESLSQSLSESLSFSSLATSTSSTRPESSSFLLPSLSSARLLRQWSSSASPLSSLLSRRTTTPATRTSLSESPSTRSSKKSTTVAPTSDHTSSFTPHSTTYTLHDRTITTFVTSEPTASSSPGGSKSLSSPKIIGGVVGSVGGVIVIGALVVLLLFLRRRGRKTTNPVPNFSETTSDTDGEKFGFKLPFTKRSSGGANGALAGMDDIQRQVDQRANSAQSAYPGDESGDFAYRGVTNSHNLESVFRPSATNSSGANTAAATSRFGLILRPLDTAYEDSFEFGARPQEGDAGDVGDHVVEQRQNPENVHNLNGSQETPGEPTSNNASTQNAQGLAVNPRTPTELNRHSRYSNTSSGSRPYPLPQFSAPYPTGHLRSPSEDLQHFNPADYYIGEETNSGANLRFREEI